MPCERGGIKRAKILQRGRKFYKEGEHFFGNGKCELIAIFSATMLNLSVKEETGSVKGETKSANFWQGKV